MGLQLDYDSYSQFVIFTFMYMIEYSIIMYPNDTRLFFTEVGVWWSELNGRCNCISLWYQFIHLACRIEYILLKQYKRTGHNFLNFNSPLLAIILYIIAQRPMVNSLRCYRAYSFNTLNLQLVYDLSFQLNISYPATGCQKLIEVDDEKKLRPFYEKRMASEVSADSLGDEWKVGLIRE